MRSSLKLGPLMKIVLDTMLSGVLRFNSSYETDVSISFWLRNSEMSTLSGSSPVFFHNICS